MTARTTELFVIGTDTGVGKTTVAAALVARARARGHSVAAIKPAETGCLDGVPDDARFLGARCPNIYRDPVAPAVAARRERRPFDLAAVLRDRAELLAESPDLLLYEGAGGLLVPYSDTLTTIDVIKALGSPPLLLVARAALGTINHTALTLAETRRHQLRVIAVVLNRTIPEMDPDTPAEVARLTGVPVIGPLPHLPPELRRDRAAIARLLGDSLDLDELPLSA